MSSFAENRYRELQVKLHRQYGYGLRNIAVAMTGLRGQTPNPESDPSMATIDSANSITVNNFDLDPYNLRSLPLGVVAGLQYNNDTFGKCFYAMVDTVNFYDFFMADLNALFEEFNFYQLLVYDPIRFHSNLAALYE